MHQPKWGLSVVILCALVWPVSAQQQDYATPIAQKAVKALGDLSKQKELQGFACQSEGTVNENGKIAQVSGTWIFHGFDQFRGDLTLQINGRSETGVLVVSGKEAWVFTQNQGKKEMAPNEVLLVLLADLHALRVAQQPHRLLNKDVKLSALGEFDIDNTKALGLNAKFTDLPEMALYFAKETGLPLKVSVRVAEPGGNEVEHAFTFGNFKEVNGIQQFTKVDFHRDNKKLLTFELSNLQLQKNIEKSMFENP